jgi:hypothetical protein
MPKNAQSTPFAKLKMIPQKMENFHEPFSHNKSGGLWLSATVLLDIYSIFGWTSVAYILLLP